MALSDLKKIEERFEEEREETAKKLSALINKRLAILRKIVPGTEYIDAMGSQHLFDKNAADQREDAAYKAMEVILEGSRIPTEEEWGEPLPEHFQKAKILSEEHEETIREIFAIGEYISEIGSVYR